jgi:hypothetical protein
MRPPATRRALPCTSSVPRFMYASTAIDPITCTPACQERPLDAQSARSLPAIGSDHGAGNFVRTCVDRGAFAGTATSPPHMIGREQEEHDKNDHE